MALVYADRVSETSSTSGTGTLSLDGAKTGFQSFVDGIGNANTCHYLIENDTDWEIGLGTVTDAAIDTLSRDTILASSNSGSAVDWAADGLQDVSCVIPASSYTANLDKLTITDNGELRVPAQPAFYVIKNSGQLNATGDGTLIDRVSFGSEVKDIGGDFSGNVFTAPVSGFYILCLGLYISDIGTAHSTIHMNLRTSNYNYILRAHPGNMREVQSGDEVLQHNFTILTYMDASDTADATLTIYGSTKIIDLVATTSSFISGVLVAAAA